MPPEVKQDRVERLMHFGDISACERSEGGTNAEVMVDREEPDFYIGRTEFDSPEVDGEVLIEKETCLEVGSLAR